MPATPSSANGVSRRSFLGWLIRGSLAGSAILGTGIVARFLAGSPQRSSPNQVDLGQAADYPLGTRIPYRAAQVLVIHDESGFRAISLVCPHLGCIVNVTAGGFTCPCHGSRFLADGSLRKGPASRPLTILRVERNKADHLIISGSLKG